MLFYQPNLYRKSFKQFSKSYNIHNLVFSGGGIKSLAYLGVIKALEELKILDNIKGYAGVSAGAIIATLLAIGMTPYELITETNKMNYNNFFEKSDIDILRLIENPKVVLDPFISGKIILNEIFNFGLSDGSYVKEWLAKMFYLKGLKEYTTFKELYDKTGKKLSIMLCNLNYSKTVEANYKNTPDLSIIQSIKGSIAVPFVFEPFEYNGDIYVDGGTMYNYPIEVFDKTSPFNQTLGFLLTSKESIFNPIRKDDDNIIDHIGCIYKAIMNIDYEYCFRLGNQYRTVFIDTEDIGFLNFNLNKDEKEWLFKQGYKATKQFFI